MKGKTVYYLVTWINPETTLWAREGQLVNNNDHFRYRVIRKKAPAQLILAIEEEHENEFFGVYISGGSGQFTKLKLEGEQDV